MSQPIDSHTYSPADKSGLRAGSTTITYNGTNVNVGGDIILKIDNQTVSKMQDIIVYISQKNAGDKVHLTILRDNSTNELDLILGQTPSQPTDLMLGQTPSQPTSQNDGNKSAEQLYPEQLYDECVSAAGKSFCDFLFKK